MYTQVEKPKEDKGSTVGNSVAQKKSKVKQSFGFMDNRMEAIAQKEIQTEISSKPAAKPIQKAGWQVVDSREKTKEQGVIDGNIVRARAKGRVLNGHKFYKDIDPEKGISDKDNVLSKNEVLHIHAHGLEGGVAGMSSDTFVNVLTSKFTVESLKGHTIIFHSCEVGAGSFLNDVLTTLMKKSAGKWNGTTILAPLRVMLVNKQGVSIVANEGHNDDDILNDEKARRKEGVLGKKGDGWAGVRVNTNNITILSPSDAKGAMKEGT